VEIFERTEGRYFILEDESGKVVVEPGSDHHGMHRTYLSKQTAMKDLEGRAKTFAQENDIKLKRAIVGLNKYIRVTERIMTPGKFLYILGNAEDVVLPVEARNDHTVSPYLITNDGNMIVSESNEERSEMQTKNSVRFEFIVAGVCFVLSVVLSLVVYFFFI